MLSRLGRIQVEREVKVARRLDVNTTVAERGIVTEVTAAREILQIDDVEGAAKQMTRHKQPATQMSIFTDLPASYDDGGEGGSNTD